MTDRPTPQPTPLPEDLECQGGPGPESLPPDAVQNINRMFDREAVVDLLHATREPSPFLALESST